MGKAETTLTDKMRKDAAKIYGDRLVLVKYHGNEYSRAGVSDLLGCLDGAFFACEVKSPDSPQHKRKTREASIEHALSQGPTVLQLAFIGHVMVAGGVAWVAATVEQFLEGLAALDSCNRDLCAWCQHPEDYAGNGPCEIHPTSQPVLP